jgi:hypothetical protein
MIAAAVFSISYPAVLHFAVQWQIVLLLLVGLFGVSVLLSHVTFRVLARYVPVEPAP